jgi:predicted MFS family arabinose efflux permease
MPAIVSALTGLGRLDPAMAGYVIGVDLAAQVAGTVLFLWQGQRVSWSAALILGIAPMVVGNLLSCLAPSTAALLVTRLVAGIGAGIVRSVCFVAFGRAKDPARAIALLNVAQIGTMAAAFAAFPWLTRAIGWFGPYLALSVLGVLTLVGAPWWPKLGRTQDAARVPMVFGRTGVVCLAAVFLYFLAQAAVWGFAEAIGAAVGESSSAVTSALELSAITGVAASAFAIAISGRVSITRALSIGACLTLAGLYLLTISAGFWPFAIGLGLFNFAWNATTPFEFATAASADSTGNTAAAFSAADGVGLAAGPAIAGMMIAAHRPLTLNVLAAICTVISIVMFASISRRGSPRPRLAA